MDTNNQLSDKELEAGIWYVVHRRLLRRIGIIAFIVFDCLLVAFVLWRVGRDLWALPDRPRQAQELVNSGVRQENERPQDLVLGGVESLQRGEVVDVITHVRNPNANWYVHFSYTIGIGDKVTEVSDGFLLPGEERIFHSTVRGGRGSLVFTIGAPSWKRIDLHEIPDLAAWQSTRLNFQVKNATFLPSVVETTKGTIARATVILKNNTAYSYVEPKFLVLLYRSGRLAGIAEVVIENFKTGETRTSEVSWFDSIGAVSNVEVVPVIDILDPTVYLNP